MGCIFNLKSNYLSDASSGGQWELVGYSVNETGSFGSGGSWPWSTNVEEDPLIDASNIQQGFYQLNYFVTGVCGGIQTIIVPIVGGGDAGVTLTIDTCTSGNLIDIFTELGAEFDGGILEPLFNYTGSGVSSSGYIENNPNSPIDAQFNPSLVSSGSYVITLNITPISPEGYQLDSCCPPSSATLIVNVLEGDLQISLDENCTIVLDSQVGCDSATFELWKDTGGGFVATGVTSLPYQTQEDADYKLVGTNCDCGTIDSNTINSSGCCAASTMVIYFDPFDCSIAILGSNGCDNGAGYLGIFKWFRSCDGGLTWELQPQFTSDYITVTDSCMYQVVSECNNGCQSYSNIIEAVDCGTGCSGALGGTQLTCIYRVASGIFCDGGILKLNKVGTGVVDTQILSVANNYPVDFDILSDGSYFVSLDCDNGCPEYVGPTFTYAGCGSPPVCDSILSTSKIGCTITATVTNCPSPIFSFFRPNGSLAYSGANNSYTVDVDGLWTIEASGCPDCPVLSSTEGMSGCEGSTCNCSALLVHNPCGNLVLTPQSCEDYVITWQYRINSGGTWSNIQTGGLSFTAVNNGDYRCRFVKSGCTTIYSNTEVIDCFGTGCGCSFDITLDEVECEIEWTETGCVGYTVFMQLLSGGSWLDIETNPSSPYSPTQNGVYRLKATKTGCPTIYSNNGSVDCVGGGCQVVITAMNVDPQNCANIIVAWSGAGGSNVVPTFSKALVNPNESCVGAGGWGSISGAQNTVANNDGTGFSNILLDSEDCDTCIRVIVDANGEGCGIDEEYVYAVCCCTDTPMIDDQSVNALYEIKVYDENGNEDQFDVYTEIDSTHAKLKGEYKVFKDGVEIFQDDIDVPQGTYVVGSSNNDGAAPKLTTGDFLTSIRLRRTDAGLFLVPLAPGTATLTGPNGTVVSSDLIYDSSNTAPMKAALEIVIKNFLDSLSLDYSFQNVIVNASGVITFNFRSKHQPTVPFAGIQERQLSGSISGVEQVLSTLGGLSTGYGADSFTYSTECGTIKRFVKPSDNPLSFSSSYNNHIINPPNPKPLTDVNGNTPSIVCIEHILSVIGECQPATYLWSTGATTESITVPSNSGFYSVVITCEDECEYIIDITI